MLRRLLVIVCIAVLAACTSDDPEPLTPTTRTASQADIEAQGQLALQEQCDQALWHASLNVRDAQAFIRAGKYKAALEQLDEADADITSDASDFCLRG